MPSATKAKVCGREKRAKYLETHASLIARQLIKRDAAFNHNHALEALIKFKSNKPVAQCKLICETEGIYLKRSSRFSSGPLRKFYPYTDIERYYVFMQDPSILIFGCKDLVKNERYYDILRVDHTKIEQIGQHINTGRHNNCPPTQANTHSVTSNSCPARDSSHSSLQTQNNTTVVDNDAEDADHDSTDIFSNNATTIITESHQPIIESELHLETMVTKAEHGDDPNFYPEESENYMPCNTMNELHIEEPTLIEPVFAAHHKKFPSSEYYANARLVQSNRHNKIDKKILQFQDDQQFLKLCEHMDFDKVKTFDFKYIEPHPIEGNLLSTQGGTYLFVARHKHPQVYDVQSEDDSSTGQDSECEYSWQTSQTINDTNDEIKADSKFYRILLDQ